jgi:hypothetical protein
VLYIMLSFSMDLDWVLVALGGCMYGLSIYYSPLLYVLSLLE